MRILSFFIISVLTQRRDLWSDFSIGRRNVSPYGLLVLRYEVIYGAVSPWAEGTFPLTALCFFLILLFVKAEWTSYPRLSSFIVAFMSPAVSGQNPKSARRDDFPRLPKSTNAPAVSGVDLLFCREGTIFPDSCSYS